MIYHCLSPRNGFNKTTIIDLFNAKSNQQVYHVKYLETETLGNNCDAEVKLYMKSVLKK